MEKHTFSSGFKMISVLLALVFAVFLVLQSSVNATKYNSKSLDFTTYLKLVDSENEAGDAQSISGGQTELAFAGFSTKPGDDQIAANSVIFRLKVQQGVEVSNTKTVLYTIVAGNENGPDLDDTDNNYDYKWFIWNEKINSGQVSEFAFSIKAAENGITDNQTETAIELEAYEYDLANDKVNSALVGSKSSNKFIVKTDKFAWNNVSTSINYNNYQTTTALLPDINILFNTTPKFNITNFGMSYAKTLTYDNTIEIPMSTVSNEPLILIEASNLFDSNNVVLSASDYTILETKVVNSKTYITKFKLKKTITNNDLPNASGEYKELSNTQASFYIKGANINTNTIIIDEALAAGATKNLTINIISNSDNTVTPAYTVDTINKDKVYLTNNVTSSNIIFKNSRETGNESNIKLFTKKIVRVGSVNTTNSKEGFISAYGNDTVSYAFGEGLINSQKKIMQKLTITDAGYDKNKMFPTSVESGNYTNIDTTTMDVEVSTNNGASFSVVKSFSSSELANNSSFNLANVKYDAIRLVYKNVAVGFKVDSAPIINFDVVDRTDPIHHGDKIFNTAKMNYEYLVEDTDPNPTVSATQSSTTYLNYKNIKQNDNGLTQTNKSAINLTTNTIAYPPKVDDVLLYNITLKNDTNITLDLSNNTIDDVFTSNLSPYSGTTTTKGGSTAIKPEFINASTTSNMILYSPSDTTQKYTDELSVVENSNNYKITIPAGYKLNPNEELKITYTMNVNDTFEDPQTIGNEFVINDTASKLIGSGQFYLSRPIPKPGVGNSAIKKVDNVTLNSAVTTLPVNDDVIAYKISFKNTSKKTIDNIIIEDDYANILDPYNDKTQIDPTYENYDVLNNSTLPLNLGILKQPASFDASQMSVSVNKFNNMFSIDLKNNKIEPDEELELIYTMKINSKSQPGEFFNNNFSVFSNNSLAGDASVTWQIDLNQEKVAIIDVVKKATAIKVGDDIPDTNSMVNNEKLSYRIDIGNYHTRLNKVADLTNIVDTIPSNISLDNNTIKLENAKTASDGTITKTTINPSEYTINIDTTTNPALTTINVKFNSPFQLKSGLINLDSTGTAVENRLYLSYEAKIDTMDNRFPSIVNEAQLITKTNVAQVFFKQTKDEYVTKSGLIYDDSTTDLDNNPDSKTYVDARSNIKIYNDKILSGKLIKTTLNDVDASSTNHTRGYEVEITNTSLAPLSLSKIIDILPKYETMDTTTIPTITYTDTEGEITTFNLKYASDNTYLNASGLVQNRVVFSKYVDGSDKDISLEKAEKNGSVIKPVKAVIKYKTTVDAAQVLIDFKKAETNTITETNSLGLYLLDPNATLLLTGGGAKADDNATDFYGSGDWDSQPLTTVRYFNTSLAKTTSKSTSPYISLKTQVVIDLQNGAEKYRDYNRDVDGVTPGDYIAWKVTYGNANNATAPIADGTELVVTLPTGIKYEGFARDENGNEVIPANLSNNGVPTIKIVDNYQVLTWKTQASYTANTGETFILRCSTQSMVYSQYGAQGYFIPKDEPSQMFYDSVVKSSAQYNNKAIYDYEPVTKDISKEVPEYTKPARMVVTSASVDVFGLLHIATNYGITEADKTTNTAKSSDSYRTIDVSDRNDSVTYDMEVLSKQASKGVRELVLINRLSDVNDKEVITDKDRDSNAKVRLVGNGNIRGTVTSIANSTVTDPDYNDSLLKIEYFVDKVNVIFTDEDWTGSSNARWLSETQLQDAGLTFDDVLAFRVTIEPTYVVEKGFKLNILFDAKLKDYNISDKIAYGSFGFKGTINSTVVNPEKVLLEPLKVGLKTKVLFDRATITKTLNESNPVNKKFEFTLNKLDKTTKAIISTSQHEVVVDTKVSDTWVGSLDIYNLDKDFDYSVVETVLSHFENPAYTITSSETDDGAIHWQFDVVNTPEETLKVTYDANGGVDAPKDDLKYYKDETVLIKEKEDMTRNNYDFVSWNTRKDGKGTSYTASATSSKMIKNSKLDSSFIIVDNTTLYAQWKQQDVTSIPKDPIPGPSDPVDPILPGSGTNIVYGLIFALFTCSGMVAMQVTKRRN